MPTNRSDRDITIAQELLESLINYCIRNDKKGLDIAELKASIATLELERMGK